MPRVVVNNVEIGISLWELQGSDNKDVFLERYGRLIDLRVGLDRRMEGIFLRTGSVEAKEPSHVISSDDQPKVRLA